ncbi:diguanylate cyclase [Inhella sp.]|uniref:diguanylate cyclase n=1 Tax=Inhella sp. TaxID=1921806 RepID=UPI0035B12890
MNRLASTLLCLVLALLTPPALAMRALLADPPFQTVADAGAIADSVVSALAVDRTGFLWVGTAVGLVRYDGHEFRRFAATDGPNEPQRNLFVRSLLVARDGRLWIGSDRSGLAVLDPVTEQWSFHQPLDAKGRPAGTVRTLAEDADGGIWAGTIGGGLHRLEPRDGTWRRFDESDGLPDARVPVLMLDADGSLWVGTWNGVARLAKGGQRFEPVRIGELPEARVITLLQRDSKGRLWLGTQRGELLRSEPGDRGWRWLDRGESGHGSPQGLEEMEHEEVWIGRSGGLEIRQAQDGSLLRHLRYSASRPWGLGGADVRVMARDPSGLLWLGSYGGGLQKHVPNSGSIWVRRGDGNENSVLGVVDVRSLAEHRSGEIWAGTSDRGVAVLDPQLRLLAELRPGATGYRGGRVGGLALSVDGAHAFVASDAGVAQFDVATRRWLRNLPVGRDRVRTLRALPDGSVLAGAQDGLYRWWPGQGAFERLSLAGGTPLTGDVNAIALREDGGVVVGGERGLYTLAPGADALQALKADGLDNVLGLLIDRRGRLWVDTEQGLWRFDLAGQRIEGAEFVSQRIGKAGQAFGANLAEDADGRIWTHRGALDPARLQYDEIGLADGVDFGTGWFRSYTPLRDGRLLFGGSRGLLVIEPQRFRPWHYAPPVVATRLRVHGQDQPLARLRPKLVLLPEEPSFSLDFAVLDLSQPGRNRYRHRLLGVSDTWVDSAYELHTAAYNGLPPGDYQLQVQATNRNGQWSTDTLMVDLLVLPAWWQTWWARLAALATSVLAIAGLLRWRTRQLAARQHWLEQRVAERTEQLQAAQRELENLARTDALTGLYNRRFAAEKLDDDLRLARRRLEEAQRLGQPPPPDADLCFFLIDLDHFKEVNDRFGHAAGDAVLKQMRERLQLVFRDADYLVRWGGEEFLVVARGTSRSAAPELAERLRRAVGDQAFDLPGLSAISLRRSCSVGFAAWPVQPALPRATGWQAVIQLADAALYTAKREGRDRWVGVGSAQRLAPERLNDSLAADGQLPAGLQLLRSTDPDAWRDAERGER